MSGVQRRVFPDSFKREAVERVSSGGLSAGKVAAELGIHETVLRRWMRQPAAAGAASSVPRQMAQVAGASPADLAAENGRLRRENERLRMEREILKKNRHHLRGGCAMKFNFVQQHRGTWPIRTMCRVLGISSSGFYAWASRTESKRTAANRQLLDDIRRIHIASRGTYGSPRVHAVLRRNGQRVGRSRVETLMRHAGIAGLAVARRRTRTTDSRHGYPIAPNLLDRNFTAQAPDQIWLADLTYIPTREGWLYLAAILDGYTRKIVGWSMRDTLHTEITLDALTMALQRQRTAAGLVHHSDRGIQYAAEAYRQMLATANLTPSMSRKGNCWDNAPMESFFHTLKTERVHHRVYATKDQARRDLFAYIERFYNSHRLHSALGYLSPTDMERKAA